MHKEIVSWSVATLKERFRLINFPEYQREPTVWDRVAKQRLIDSMSRQFDIASLYIYDNEDGQFDCIDGRQRIGAILAFLGENLDDEHNKFEYRILNEIYKDESPAFETLNSLSWEDIAKRAKEGEGDAVDFISLFNTYELNVVILAKSNLPEEFNLQFTRLNLGTILNSGEKLHAMVGEMHDACFGTNSLGEHAFLAGIKIPTRRFSREQVAAQILAQVFELEKTDRYARTRHYDLQRFFKENATLESAQRRWVERTRQTLDRLAAAFADLSVLNNRAITVSTVLLAWETGVKTSAQATKLAAFMTEFLCRLRWQIKKGFAIDPEYLYLTEFQRHVTQASVEPFAVAERARTLQDQYAKFLDSGRLSGDSEYVERTGKQPATECRPWL